MAAIGRILQVLGWLWIIAGIAGSFFNFGGFNVFPGIILLFVSRALRKQTRRSQIPDIGREQEQEPAYDEPEVPERMLNTDRHREVPPPEPEPVVLDLEEPEPSPSGDERGEMIERILAAGREVSDVTDEAVSDEGESVDSKPISSAEMIARAHDRWDSKDG